MMYFHNRETIKVRKTNNILSTIFKYKLFMIIGVILVIFMPLIVFLLGKREIFAIYNNDKYMDSFNSNETVALYLNTYNDDIDIYVNVGEEYVEPGYQVFSMNGEDFYDNVLVSGDVDTSKEGTYKLTYSLMDDDDVLVSKSRNVVVIDEPKNLIDTSHYSYNNGINNADVVSIDVSNLSCTIVNYLLNVDKKIKVHASIAEEFYGILENVCDYVNETPWIDNLQHAGAFVSRKINQYDYHSKGLAIDLNNEWTYTYNGKVYEPYSWQGISTWKDYNEFICDVCDGKEDCPYNVNYIIFKRYFEGNGWCWGGNYGSQWFDPMHFELRDYGKCSVSKRNISCK